MTFLADEGGVTAIEYGLIAGLIAVVIMGLLSLTGETLSIMVSDVANSLLSNTPEG